jgi:hypothetical protein
LQKSSKELQIEVVETRHQVQAQTESFPSVSILLAQDSAYFQLPEHVLTDDASTGQNAILSLLLHGQLASRGFLLGSLALMVPFLYPLIAAVG